MPINYFNNVTTPRLLFFRTVLLTRTASRGLPRYRVSPLVGAWACKVEAYFRRQDSR